MALPIAPARAQEDPRLVDALRLAQEGRSDSARARVNQLLQATPASDTLYPQMLYTLGLVSGNLPEMRRLYSRVAVEHPFSSYADDALYRLALLDYAAGSFPEAIRQLEQLAGDYPDSPLLGPGSEWAARAYFDQKRPRDGCRWLTLGLPRAGDDVELKNRLEYLNARCATLAADTAKAPAESAKAAPAGSRSGYAVQIGAVNARETAEKLLADLKSMSMTGYVVPAGSLFKVRAGPFGDRAAADQAQAKLKARFGGSPFVVKEP
jgi:tetratricopeptide (TPR) repeat protein